MPHPLRVLSESTSVLVALWLSLGVLVLFAVHYWHRLPEVARKRWHLLSICVLLVLLAGGLKFYHSRDAEADDEFLRATAARPHSALQTATAAGRPLVATYHNDNARTGQNTLETTLTPDNVNAAQFGKLYSFPVDGYIYAQPLYVPQVAIPGSGVRNLVIVATQHDSVYAFDSDSSTTQPVWKVSFLNPDAGIAPVTPDDVGSSDILPEIGITSTPVVDVATNTIYVVAATRENGSYFHRLHALDLASGAEKFGGPRVIQATFPGVAQDAHDGVLSFASRLQLQRAALLLSKGNVYTAFASYGDSGLYHGWVVAHDAATLRQTGAWVSTPDGYQGGIWMSGCGPSSDNDGSVYLSIANGPFDAVGDEPGRNYSDGVVKLKQAGNHLALTDYFVPYNQAKLAEGDVDLGSSGVVLLPEEAGGYFPLAITSGKDGHIYLLNRRRLGGYSERKGNPQIVQEVGGQLRQQMGTPAYWNGRVYFGAGTSPTKDAIKSFGLQNGLLTPVPVSQTAPVTHLSRMTVSVSANGNRNGIVWTVDGDGYFRIPQGAAVLHAYDATNLSRELYNSNQRLTRDNPGLASKFTVPTVADGKVYVGGANQLSVYGLLRPAGK